MEMLPILRFDPLYKATVWGGRRLETVMGGQLPGDDPYGESWELVDLPTDQSVVVGGPLAGKTLGDLRTESVEALLGNAPLLADRFPLLFKFLDAGKTLSVQVHPDEAACARIGGGARPKTEAWFIIATDPGAVLYVGLKPGVDKPAFREAIASGTVEQLLHKITVAPGDFIFLPSGTIHAIGGGILLAEVQQSSDTTYRVFDWNRVGLDGKPRDLHVEQALESIAFGTSGVPETTPPPSGRPGIACDHFVMESILLGDGEQATLSGSGMLTVMGIEGDGQAVLRVGEQTATLKRGQTRLIPACLAHGVSVTVHGKISLLAVRIPT
jgi:mannose-6-phosphate isomerase